MSMENRGHPKVFQDFNATDSFKSAAALDKLADDKGLPPVKPKASVQVFLCRTGTPISPPDGEANKTIGDS